MEQNLILALLRAEVLPTMGCTEPGAVALAAAYASQTIAGKILSIQVNVNANIYKNGVAVGIPGTGETGLHIAAALGAIKKNPERQLSTLEDVLDAELELAKSMLKDELVQVRVDETKNALWVQVRITTDCGYSEAVIMEKHTNLVRLERNGEILFHQGKNEANGNVTDHRRILSQDCVRVAEIIETVVQIPDGELKFLLEGVEMNLLAAKAGLDQRLGMGVGAAIADMVKQGVLSDDMVNYAKTLTAAAADARMSGENIRVMSSAGSGNHGITAILPVYAVAKRIQASQEQLAKAVAISHLITIYVKIYTGNLSALCGCAVAAATGATAAITWMMGGDVKKIEAAMKNIVANLTGMICDGGKVGCALKLSTAAAAAVESSLLAQRNIIVPDTNGIIAETIEQTVKNLGQVSAPGMINTDKVIMGVMLGKEEQKLVC
jgi:L-cysteine desulfidase